MRFSERKGFTAVSNVIQKNEISQDLRSALWNVLLEYGINTLINERGGELGKKLWCAYLKRPFDELPTNLAKEFKTIIFSKEWYLVYDLLEFILNYFDYDELNNEVNLTLEKELSAYRFVGKQITDITSEQEIEMLEDVLNDEDFPHVKAHLQRALELLSDRKNPDYRNSIKESISAVESIAKEIAQKPKAELGDALKEIENQGKIHGAMKKAFLNLYGYTSDANGIRHALMEESNLTADDAKFFLLSCTSFINYLKAKM